MGSAGDEPGQELGGAGLPVNPLDGAALGDDPAALQKPGSPNKASGRALGAQPVMPRRSEHGAPPRSDDGAIAATTTATTTAWSDGFTNSAVNSSPLKPCCADLPTATV
ncbi:hypothetical protein GCM10010121_085070 [Streptomyces brasiliensis]|uniref:Uncharacterized protein n=1 Tax=Streptomyces brasiliensis TaxID=1954 RepID=A0A917P4U9_9ACTN|nr:hypothetical protein GCM10010121_085070 [Streptomyces brasiliensis]